MEHFIWILETIAVLVAVFHKLIEIKQGTQGTCYKLPTVCKFNCSQKVNVIAVIVLKLVDDNM